MKVLLTAIGSSGDINPSIAIGRALQARGQHVTLLVNPYFQQQIERVGLGFAALGSADELRRLEKSVLKRNPAKWDGWRELVLPSVPRVVEALDRRLSDDRPDLVIYHPLTIGARWVCERHGVRHALAALSPLVWMSREDGGVYSRMGLRDTPPRWLSRLLLGAAKYVLRWKADRELNPIRRRFGFSPGRDLFFDHVFNCDLNLGMWSPMMRGSMPDDPPNGHICGFPWFDRGRREQPADDELERFLHNGEPPIIFTMGSSLPAAMKTFYESAAEACRKLGRRGLLLAGDSADALRDLTPEIMAVRYAPHSSVFPHGRAIVHHGGAGTMSQALRAGKPSVIIPIVSDQFDHAARLKRMGVALTLAQRRAGLGGKITAERLAALLRRVLEDSEMNRRAEGIGAKLRREDGTERAAELIEGLSGN